MINTTLIQIRQQIEQLIYVHDTADPVTVLLKNLSSNPDWRVKIRNNESQVSSPIEPKSQSIQLKIDNNTGESGSPRKEFSFLNVFTNKRSPNFPNQNQKILLEKLRQVPIYTVVNNFNEVIVSSPREDNQKNTLNHIRTIYNELFFWSYDEGPVSILLFFMNEQDAGSYLHEICKRDPKEAEKLGLTVKRIGLDTFYKFNRISPPKIQAKLVGDLKEIDSVIRKTNKSTFPDINSKQRYAKDWFQGIPIYQFKLNVAQNAKSLLESKITSEMEKKYIFFNENDANLAWTKAISKDKTMKTNAKANLEIYNLENLLLDLEKTEISTARNVILVPPYERSRESKLNKIAIFNVEYSSQTRVMYSLKLKLEEVKRFYKGLLWLLTSDTLPSEENSW